MATWRFYNSSAESENRIKELKEDFGADGFCLQSFDGTEAAFRLICFLANLIAEFKREVTQDQAPRISALRTQVWVVGAILGREVATRCCVRVCATVGTSASPRRWNVSPRSPFQLGAVHRLFKNPALRPWKPRWSAHRHPLVLVPN